ncbi:MAG: N-acetylmuramoyl-L-alanine amidase [Candidatus Wallbacteria bacterium]|nr:N-acetylmuramoyl-L-alanine amidase [Candidatus Wallbacteria bacterium]
MLSPFRREALVSSGGLEYTSHGAVTLHRNRGRLGPRGGFISAVLRADRLFDLFQVGYEAEVPPGCSVSVQFRTYARGSEAPSAWIQVAPEDEPAMSSTCDRLQFRVVLTSSGDQAPVLSTLAIQQATHDTLPGLRAPRVAMCAPGVVPRRKWGALAPRQALKAIEPEKIAVHHSSEPRASQYAGASTIRGIQRFHMFERGWNDIAYHYLIGPDGTIFEGRPERLNGSHSPANGNKLGICVLGNFNRGAESITPRARASLLRMLAYLAGKYGISSRSIYGHCDFNSTDCPGDTLYGSLALLRSQVEVLLHRHAGTAACGAGT